MEGFTDPFRYAPHPLVRKAARDLMERLDRMIEDGTLSHEVAKGFTDGKMLGVLVCQSEEGSGVGMPYLAAFSGSVGGTSIVEGFVPPIFDLTEKGGFYRTHEAEISAINAQIRNLEDLELYHAKNELDHLMESSRCELEEMRDNLKRNKYARMTIRKSWDAEGREYYDKTSALALQSQHEKAEYNRAKDRWKSIIKPAEERLAKIQESISSLKKRRAQMSEELQRWIFDQYLVHNAAGDQATILEIFNKKCLVPPGGTGDCAAPKLLNHAYLRGLKPLAMGEFWYGKSPTTAVRTHGHFYPSCTSKCGPLLGFMLEGLSLGELQGPPPACAGTPYPGVAEPHIENLQIIYSDKDIIVVSKQSGVPSVPGLDGRKSLQEVLSSYYGQEVHPVHRLDMDTSGIMVFAKTHEAEISLKRQFEEHSISKTYIARLSPADMYHSGHYSSLELKEGAKGVIEIPLSPDYDERPRQKADTSQGKPSLTAYEVVSINADGTTDIIFHPHTGRTHQLRVHSAHILGLGRPILGDLLYGGCGNVWRDIPSSGDPENQSPALRLHLHALSITFRHPSTGEPVNFSTSANSYL